MTIPAATTTTTCYPRCSLIESTGPVCSVHVAPGRGAERRGARPRPSLFWDDTTSANREGDDDRWRSRMLGLAFGESECDGRGPRRRLLYGVKDELMGSSDWWGGMVLAPTQPWPHRVEPRRLTACFFYEEAVPPEVLFGAEAPPLEALASGRALRRRCRVCRSAFDAHLVGDRRITVFGGVARRGA